MGQQASLRLNRSWPIHSYIGERMKDTMNNGIYQAGQRLRQIREERGLTLKDVEEQSQRLAEKTQIMDYLITAERVSQVENNNSLPSVYRLATLSFIYKLPLTEMFHIYGIDIPTAEEPLLMLSSYFPFPKSYKSVVKMPPLVHKDGKLIRLWSTKQIAPMKKALPKLRYKRHTKT